MDDAITASMSDGRAMLRLRTKPGAVALIVFVFVVVQLAGHRWLGLTDDDDFYIPAGQSYAAWLGRVFRGDSSAWHRTAIDAAFTVNHEHPPVAKYAFGIFGAIFEGWVGPVVAPRLATTFFATAILVAMLWLGRRCFGRRRGTVIAAGGAFCLLVHPRFYFHAHAATLDVPVAATYFIAALVALHAERNRAARMACGPMFGVALATKLNAPFMLLPHAAFCYLARLRDGRIARGRFPVPVSLISMAVLGPLVFVGLWPWLWFDTWARLSGYIAFHLHHYPIHFLYYGRIFDADPFAPWTAPFVMFGATTPTPVLLLLAAAGLGLVRLSRRARASAKHRPEYEVLLACALHALTAIAVVAFSGGPKYGGMKLFLPAYPFVCVLAGWAMERLLARSVQNWGRLRAGCLSAGAALLMAGYPLSFGAYGLSAYNGLVGGLPGATAAGLERQYYDVAFRDLVDWLNQTAPSGLRVHFLPNNWEYIRTYKWYKLEGRLRPDLRVVRSEGAADWLVLTHERRFQRYAGDLRRYRHHRVLREHVLHGVPLWTVYDRRGESK